MVTDNRNKTHLNVPMLGAIYNGIHDLNLNDSYICSTGNCEWDGWIPSLAVCSRCADVTDQVNKSCGPLPSELITNDGDLDPTNGWCSLTTPSGLEVSTLFYFNIYTTFDTNTMVNSSIGPLGSDDGLTLLRMVTAIARNDHIN